MRTYSEIMRKTIFTTLLLALLLIGCHNQPTTTLDKIDALKQQVMADADALRQLDDNDYAKLQKDFWLCDSLLQYSSPEIVDTQFEQLNLVQAYLSQFDEVMPKMHYKMEYAIEQLDRLKSDAESHYLSDSLVLVYLDTETKVADTLHAQVAYFKDRFKNSQEMLNELKNSKK